MVYRLIFAFLLSALLVRPALAQNTTGELVGRVIDDNGNPMPGISVQIDGRSLINPRQVVTTENGVFLASALPVGTYTLSVQQEGFQEATITEIIVLLGRTTPIDDITLVTEAVVLPELVVYGSTLPIDPVSTATGVNLTPEDYEPLPVDRDYRSIGLLTPQWEQSYLGDEISAAGATGNENRFYVDGVDVTEPIRGFSSIQLPYNLVREIEVKTGGYEAEYRATLGGIQNMVTYAGGNEWHGQLFGFYTGDGLAREERTSIFDRPGDSFTEYDVGLSVGGPLVRNKLWFFGAYNPTFLNRDVETPGFGYRPDEVTTHIFAGKLTWDAATTARITLSVFGDPSSRDGVEAVGTGTTLASLDPVLVKTDAGGYAGVLQADIFPGDRSLVQVSVSYNQRRDRRLPATQRGFEEPQFFDNTDPTGVQVMDGGVWRTDDLARQTQVSLEWTTRLGDHLVKAGAEYKHVSVDVDHFWQTLAHMPAGGYFELTRDVVGNVGNRLPSAFLQDSWQLVRRLRLNLGLRWDGQYLVASDGKVRQEITDQYQPRLGFVWQPGEYGTQRVFGSFGRFYQELATTLSDFYHIEGALTSWIIYDEDPREVPSEGFPLLYDVIALEDGVEGLKGQYQDEYTLGYERQIQGGVKTGVTGIYRTMGSAIEDGFVEDRDGFWYGNPGRGELEPFPEARREYWALVLTLQRARLKGLNFLVSYTLSRTEGNYMGLFNTDFQYVQPNANGSFDYVENLVNGDGLLPNDRTHRLKLNASYRMDFGLTVGTTLFVMSGTPLSVFAESPRFPTHDFAETRGTNGRTPTTWDLNFRLAYELPNLLGADRPSRVLLDIFHLGNPRTVVNYDQVKYFLDDEFNPTILNPTYGKATAYQPPAAVRLGLEVGF